jgi:putative hydrolase of the HAD superfamily
MEAPKLMLFDLGGVLVENAAFGRLGRLLPGSPGAEDLRGRWMRSSAVRRFELGQAGPGEFADEFIAEWGLGLSAGAFLAEFGSWVGGLAPGALEALRSLRARYRVACLSNCSELHWEKFGGFLGEFDQALSSHLIGAMKPDEEAFRRAFAHCGVEPAAVCFFDDTPMNVEAARRLGARAFRVEGVGQLVATLRAQGFLSA